MRIDAEGIYYKDLNDQIHAAVAAGETDFILDNVRGQRYLGNGLGDKVSLTINGVPGNDMASFMNGARIVVNGNAQDAVGNTMNNGRVIIHGVAGDIIGYGMRGGRIHIKGDVGYRCGIHMKAYMDNFPVLCVGGRAQDYLGEYMAGGIIILLNLADYQPPTGYFLGTGMHGGKIFIRGTVAQHQVGQEVGFQEVSDEEWAFMSEVIDEFYGEFGDLERKEMQASDFVKLYPKSTRPYGNLYSY